MPVYSPVNNSKLTASLGDDPNVDNSMLTADVRKLSGDDSQSPAGAEMTHTEETYPEPTADIVSVTDTNLVVPKQRVSDGIKNKLAMLFGSKEDKHKLDKGTPKAVVGKVKVNIAKKDAKVDDIDTEGDITKGTGQPPSTPSMPTRGVVIKNKSLRKLAALFSAAGSPSTGRLSSTPPSLSSSSTKSSLSSADSEFSLASCELVRYRAVPVGQDVVHETYMADGTVTKCIIPIDPTSPEVALLGMLPMDVGVAGDEAADKIKSTHISPIPLPGAEPEPEDKEKGKRARNRMLAGEAVQVARLNAERRQEMVKEQARLNCAEAKARLEDPTTDKVPGTPTPTRFNKGNIAAIRERYLGYKDLKMLEEQINERRRVSLLRPIPVPSTKLIEPAATISKPPKDVIPKADVGCTEVVPAPSTIDIPTPIVETVSTPPEEPVPETPKAVSLTLSTADSRDDASDTSLDSPWTKAPLPTSRPGDHAPPLRMPTFLTPEVPQPVDKPLPKALSQAFGLPKRDQQLIIRIPSRQERLAAAATLIAERAKVAVQVHSVIDVQEFDPKAAAKSPARSPKTRTPAVRLPRPVKARNIPGAAPSRIPVLRRATRARKVPETPLYRPVQERDTENLMRNVLINCARRVSPVPQKPKTPVTELRLTDTITTPRPQVPTAAFARPVGPRLSKHQEKTPIVPRPKRTDVPARPQVPNAAFARATQVFPAPPSAEKAREIRCKTVDIPARRPLPSAAFALPIRVAKPPVKKDSHSKIIRPAAARPQLQSARPTSVRGAKSPDSPYPARLVKRADENSPPATKCSSTAKGDVRRPALRPLRILEGITIPGGAKLSGCTA